MEAASSSSLVCSADVAAFVDALETINYNEAECYDASENVVICISEPECLSKETNELSVTDIEDACAETGSHYFNPDTRKLKAIMQQLVAQKKAVVVKKSLSNGKGAKQFKSDVWNWFGDVRLFISESDAERLKIPYYVRFGTDEDEQAVMICKVFVGCFRCSALFMYDAQKHSTSTLRYHVRACNRPKECIYVSEDKLEEEPSPSHRQEKTAEGRPKRFRTDPRKQKEVIEQLFQKQRAVVTRKSFMNMKGNRRFKSDVWNWFGDVKLLISRSEAKKLKIPYYIRRCGDEQMVLSKVFVGCFKCMALFIHDSQKSTSTLRYHIRTCSRPKERKKRSTPNIIFFPSSNSRRRRPSPRQTDSEPIRTHEKLLDFALSTESSLELAADPEFHKVLQMCIAVGALYGDVNVDSLLCATPTLTGFVLNDLYVTSVNAFYTEFQHAYGATYRVVPWVEEQRKAAFVSVHCSYADAEGELKSVVLHTDDFDYDSKEPEQLREWFGRFLGDQPVIPFKRLLCVDGESNLLHAFRDEACVRCAVQGVAGAVQAVVSRGTSGSGELPDFTNLLANCVDIADYLERVAEHCLPLPELVKCPDDKWTSVLALFRSVERQYDDVLNVLNETNATHLLSADRPAIEAAVDFLTAFENVVLELSEGTLNLVLPCLQRLRERCLELPEDLPVLRQLKTNVGVELSERTAEAISLYHRMATFLDPRFKKMPSSEALLKVKSLVKECMEAPNADEESHRGNDRTSPDEVDRYAAAPCLDVSPLAYWKQHSDVYPHLSRVAQWLLTCPASSTSLGYETFWSNNWLVHCPRFPIEHDNVNKVLFVKSFRGL